MVNEVSHKGRIIYACEVCGFGYADLETAERCEQYCFSHGHQSPKLAQKAIRRPRHADPILAA
jgi:hypothetical protein